jgi:transposase
VSRALRPNYAQRFLLPPALDEWVPANHPVRFVRDFVDALNLAELGIPEPVADEGRPPYGPDLLLKVWLFGYMERIRSTRALEKACLQVMPFLWLTGNLHPDHNTLWRFFNIHRKALPKLFKRLVKIVSLRKEPETKGKYSKAYFHYDAQSNVYMCPKGETLVQIGTNKSHATTEHPDAIYRCRNKTCPVLADCMKDPLGEDARERQEEKQQDPRMRTLLSLRKEIVEHLFGIVKAVDGFRRFTVRGLEKASAQGSLVCMAVNLRKLSAMATWRAGKLTPLLRSASVAPA